MINFLKGDLNRRLIFNDAFERVANLLLSLNFIYVYVCQFKILNFLKFEKVIMLYDFIV